MKKISIGVVIFAAILLAYSCKKSKKKTEVTEKSRFTVSLNGADPLIVNYATKTGEQIDFFGTRNALGVPQKLTGFIIRKNNDTTFYLLDDQARPVNIITSKKTQIQFTWLAPQQAAITVISNNGIDQLNTSIDFSKAPTQGSSANALNKSYHQRKGNLSKIKFKTFNNLKGNLSTNATGDAGNVVVKVTSCGQPSEGTVSVYARSLSGSNLGYFPTSPTGNGIYVASLPTNLAPKLNVGEICGDIENMLGYYCTASEAMPALPLYLCVGLTEAAVLSGVGAVFASEIAFACAEATAGLEIYCNTVGKEIGAGGPTIGAELCRAEVLDRTFTQDISIFAGVDGIPDDVYSLSHTVSGSGPFPTLNVENSLNTFIRSLTLNPPSPPAGQNYVARADVYCVKERSTVVMSIAGTDGYVDSETTIVSANQTNGIFILEVPGAESGVQDLVTIEITDPAGKKTTKTAQLIFI